MEEIKGRLNEAINYLAEVGLLNGKEIVKDIAAKTGFHPGKVREARRGIRRSLTEKFVERFCMVYGNVLSSQWIWYGVGDMLKSNEEISTSQKNQKMVKLPSDSDETTRPRLPVAAEAGHLTEFIDGVMSYQCEHLPVIRRFPDYDFTVLIRGNSMEPKYEGGDEIALKKATIIEWGKDYVLDTADGPIFKKIYDADENIRCVSYNKEEYPDFFIPKSSIYGYYKFVGLIRI